jgi:3-mercaptopyruvate sulfurtransferase SseA
MILVAIGLILFSALIKWAWDGLEIEDSQNKKWEKAERELFNQEHYEEIRKMKEARKKARKIAEEYREWRMLSGKDTSPYNEGPQDD